jgi:hypothetical protein
VGIHERPPKDATYLVTNMGTGTPTCLDMRARPTPATLAHAAMRARRADGMSQNWTICARLCRP